MIHFVYVVIVCCIKMRLHRYHGDASLIKDVDTYKDTRSL